MASIGAGWVTGAWVEAAWATGAWAKATAVLSGTAIGGLLEAEVVTGGDTIIITLTNDKWVAAGIDFNNQRQAIIDGLDSDGVEGTGWNAEVRDKEVVGAVARISDTVVTITLSAAAAYDIVASEEITVTIPAAALLVVTDPVIAAPTLVVTAFGVAVDHLNNPMMVTLGRLMNR